MMRVVRIGAALLATACLGADVAGAAQESVVVPKGTTVQKVGPGQFRFRLPDGRMIEARNMNARAGIIGDCGVYEATGRKLAGGVQCQWRGGSKGLGDPDPPPAARGDASPASMNYVRIDDEVTWLPATLVFTGTTLIDPSPTGRPSGLNPQQRKMINPQPEPPKPAIVR